MVGVLPAMRDEFAHARIDGLQQQVAEWLADMMMSIPGRHRDYDDHVTTVRKSFTLADDFAERKLAPATSTAWSQGFVQHGQSVTTVHGERVMV